MNKPQILEGLEEENFDSHLIESGLVVADSNGVVRIVNPPYLTMHQLHSDQVVGKPLIDHYNEKGQDSLKRLIKRTLAKKQGELTIDHKLPDGKMTVLLFSSKVVYYVGNKTKFIMVTIKELTDQQKSDRVLRKEYIISQVRRLGKKKKESNEENKRQK
jgi:PAS domain S-box-containing protein